jgi:hypothetical protein
LKSKIFFVFLVFLLVVSPFLVLVPKVKADIIKTVLLSDDFETGVINSTLWNYVPTNITVSNQSAYSGTYGLDFHTTDMFPCIETNGVYNITTPDFWLSFKVKANQTYIFQPSALWGQYSSFGIFLGTGSYYWDKIDFDFVANESGSFLCVIHNFEDYNQVDSVAMPTFNNEWLSVDCHLVISESGYQEFFIEGDSLIKQMANNTYPIDEDNPDINTIDIYMNQGFVDDFEVYTLSEESLPPITWGNTGANPLIIAIFMILPIIAGIYIAMQFLKGSMSATEAVIEILIIAVLTGVVLSVWI